MGIPVSSTNKTDHHDITEILLKVALNITNLHLLCINVSWSLIFAYVTEKYIKIL
jgi:hypothetical protein